MSADATARLTLDTSRFQAGISKASSLMGGLGSSIGRIASVAAPLIGIAGAAIGVGSAFGIMTKSISSAAEFETLKTGFVTLLGTMDAAEERIAELSKFAADTPFELPEIARASRTLETLTKGALSTGKGLTLVGDVASGVNQPFEDLAVHIGRLYDGLQSGRPVGEAMARLQELGVISGDTRGEIEKLQKSGAKGDQVWGVAEAALGRLAGNMKRQSGTWNGLMSTLSDNIGAVFREFGTPIMDSLKPLLKSLVDYTSGLAEKAKEFGSAVANAFALVQQAFASGELGSIVALALQVGFAKGVNFLMAAFRGVIAMLISGFTTAPGRLMEGLKALFDPNLWTGLGQILFSVGQGFIAVLSAGLAPLMDKLIGVLNKIPGVNIGFNADDFAGSAKEESAKNWSEGLARLGGALTPLGERFADDTATAMAEFQKAFAAAPGLLDEGGPSSQLSALFAKLQSAVDADAAKKLAEEGNAATAGNAAADLGVGKLISSSLASIGLGGYTSASSSNPELAETRKQSRIQERTMRAVEKLASGGGVLKVVPVFGAA